MIVCKHSVRCHQCKHVTVIIIRRCDEQVIHGVAQLRWTEVGRETMYDSHGSVSYMIVVDITVYALTGCLPAGCCWLLLAAVWTHRVRIDGNDVSNSCHHKIHYDVSGDPTSLTENLRNE